MYDHNIRRGAGRYLAETSLLLHLELYSLSLLSPFFLRVGGSPPSSAVPLLFRERLIEESLPHMYNFTILLPPVRLIVFLYFPLLHETEIHSVCNQYALLAPCAPFAMYSPRNIHRMHLAPCPRVLISMGYHGRFMLSLPLICFFLSFFSFFCGTQCATCHTLG